MRIAVFTYGSSSGYRVYQPMEELALCGHQVLLNDRDLRPTAAMLQCDVALISRWVGPLPEQLVARFHRAGVPVVWQIDDAVIHDVGIRKQQAEINEMTRRMLRGVDLVITTTEDLAQQYRAETRKPVHAIGNYPGPQFYETPRQPHVGVVIGWAAWLDHQADWEALGMGDVVLRLLDAHPTLRIESLGPIDLQLETQRYTRKPAVEFPFMAHCMATFDIGIAPIVDSPFNAARSDIKLKEYAALGIPWLASPIGPYAGLGEKQGGRLVPDDRWYEELDRLISDKRGRRKLAKRGLEWATRNRMEDHVDLWERALEEASERVSSPQRALR